MMASAVLEREMPGGDASRAAAGGGDACCAGPAADCMAVPPRWLCSPQLLGHRCSKALSLGLGEIRGHCFLW